MSICLTNDEIYGITHRKKYSKQREVLNSMGIDNRVRPDGTIAVLRDWLANTKEKRKPEKTHPNLDALK